MRLINSGSGDVRRALCALGACGLGLIAGCSSNGNSDSAVGGATGQASTGGASNSASLTGGASTSGTTAPNAMGGAGGISAGGSTADSTGGIGNGGADTSTTTAPNLTGGTSASSVGGTTASGSTAGGSTAGGTSALATGGVANGGNATGGTSFQNVPAYLQAPAISSFYVGLTYGSPYDSILAQPIRSLNSAIKPGFTTEAVAGQVVQNYFYQQVATTSDLYSALQVSASMDVNSGAFGASAKLHYAQSKQIDSSKIYIFVDATSSGVTQRVVNPELTDAAKAMSALEFYHNFGDRYVTEIVTGAELFGTIEIETTSEADKQAISASLKVSYGPSSVSADYASQLNTATTNHKVTVDVQRLGNNTIPLPTTADDFINEVQQFGTIAAAASDVSKESLYLVYGSYYGIAGYPGVPDGTDEKVTREAKAVSDFLLYDSLINNEFAAYYADPNDASLPFFSGMKTYRDALNQFLQASFTDSQTLPQLPANDAASHIETYTTDAVQVTGTPNFNVHTLHNGIVPKRLSDYDIPLHYAHSGSLNGVTFTPVQSVAASTNITAKLPLNYQLYLVDKTQAPNPQHRVLSYRWGTGTYFLDNATSSGAPDNSLILQQLNSLTLNDFHHSELGFYRFVLVNKASGQLMTHDTNYQLIQSPFILNNPNQTFEFQLAGCGGGTTYSPGQVLYGYLKATNNWLDIDHGRSADGSAVGTYDWANCADNQTFFINPRDGGNMYTISGYGSDANVNVSVDPGASTAAPPSGALIVVQGQSNNDNQLWRLIPVEYIDTAP